jgi:hypothetical protein
MLPQEATLIDRLPLQRSHGTASLLECSDAASSCIMAYPSLAISYYLLSRGAGTAGVRVMRSGQYHPIKVQQRY